MSWISSDWFEAVLVGVITLGLCLVSACAGYVTGAYRAGKRIEQEKVERELKRKRELHDAKRTYPAREGAPSARVHKATFVDRRE